MTDVRITGVDVFDVAFDVPADAPAWGLHRTETVVRVDTTAGISGYAFTGQERPAFYAPGPREQVLERSVRPALLGADLFAVERHLRTSGFAWGPLEHALWDAVGRVLGEPVYRLFGGGPARLPVYLTCVWPGVRPGLWAPERPGTFAGARPGLPPDEPPRVPEVSYEDQATWAVELRDAGFRGMKIGTFRSNPLDMVEACAHIREAVGAGFALMVDHAGGLSERPWDFDTALAVAQGLEASGVAWLEEPLALDDFEGLARLGQAVDIPIAGGNDLMGLEHFRQAVVHGAYDILQPDAAIAGGLLATSKVVALAQAFETRCFLHGDSGLALAGWLQLSAVMQAEWVEIGIVVPPLLPEQQWEPATQVLRGDRIYDLDDGEIVVPDRPGLGLDLDEDAIEALRVRA